MSRRSPLPGAAVQLALLMVFKAAWADAVDAPGATTAAALPRYVDRVLDEGPQDPRSLRTTDAGDTSPGWPRGVQIEQAWTRGSFVPAAAQRTLFGSGLAWGTGQVVNDLQGAYWRGSTQSARWSLGWSTELSRRPQAGSATATYASAFAQYRIDTRTVAGSTLTWRRGPFPAEGLQWRWDSTTDWGPSSVRLDTLRTVDSRVLSVSADQGVAQWATGALSASLGWQTQTFARSVDRSVNWGVMLTEAPSATTQGQITAAFSATAALRAEDYSDFGRATAVKLSGRYVVSPALALRGTLSTGFRAPSLAQQYFATTSTNLINGALVEAGTFTVPSAAAQALGALPLKAETSRNLSLGVQLQLSRDWQTTLDVYQIDINHRILLSANLSLPTALRNQLAAQGLNVSTGRYFTNALDTRTRGADLVSTWRQDWAAAGRSDFTLAYGYTEQTVRRVADNPAVLTANNLVLIDRVTLARATVSAPKDKLLLAVEHRLGAWSGRLAATRYGSYEVRQASAVNDQLFAPAWLADLSLGWAAGAWRVDAGVDNLTNRYPDRVIAANAVGGILTYSSFSPFGFNGRQYYAKVGYRW
ncbi:TonB-dependent receptor [Ostertagia ostertagi]